MKLTALLAGLLLAGTAMAAQNDAARVRAFATLPDWTGYWQTPWAAKTATPSGRGSGGDFRLFLATLPTLGHPPALLPEWDARYNAARADTAARQAEFANFKGCGAGSVPMEKTFPFVFEAPMVFQIVVTPEETFFVFDHGQVRHVYTDGRKPPPAEDLWPTPMGFSLGHWKDGVLTIETTARSAGPIAPLLSPTELSDQVRFTERLRQVDKDTIENEMTIEDPLRFAKPWQVRFRFSRLPGMDRMIEYDCDENDRNPIVDGKLSVTEP
jgi:hypothetical protein